jgi:hypothetical protein
MISLNLVAFLHVTDSYLDWAEAFYFDAGATASPSGYEGAARAARAVRDGAGRLGGAMVPVGKAFGMDVVAWSQHLTEERCAELGVAKVTKDVLLASADVLRVFLVFSERSRNALRADDPAAMKPGAIVVNVSRGPDPRGGGPFRGAPRRPPGRRRPRCLRPRAAPRGSPLPVADPRRHRPRRLAADGTAVGR